MAQDTHDTPGDISGDAYGIAKGLGLTDGHIADDDIAFRTGDRLAERFIGGSDEFAFGAWLDDRVKASDILRACARYGTQAVMSQAMTVRMASVIADALAKGGDEADRVIDRMVSIAYEDE